MPCRVLASTPAVRRVVLAGLFAAGIVLCGWVVSDRAQAAEAVPGVPTTTGQPVAGDAVAKSAPAKPGTDPAQAPAGPGTSAMSSERSNAATASAHTPVSPAGVVSAVTSPTSAKAVGAGATAAATPGSVPKRVTALATPPALAVSPGEPPTVVGSPAASGVGREVSTALGDLGLEAVSLLPPSTDALVGDLPSLRPTEGASGGVRDGAAARSTEPVPAPETPTGAATPEASGVGQDTATELPVAVFDGPRRVEPAQPALLTRQLTYDTADREAPSAPVGPSSAASTSDDAVNGSGHRVDAPGAVCAAPAPTAAASPARPTGSRTAAAGPSGGPGDVPVSPA
ncbi:hypothetical protein [Yinghuangia aomiensis]|uniref:hypothetical protein n=1 Tax=Yinghuangia aomiensis TaxID=676205 RepID=UPI0031E4F024